MSDAGGDAAFAQAREHFSEGLRHHEAGRDAEAERSYLASLALLPGRASTLVNLAAVRLRLGRPQQALEAAQQLLDADPDNVDALFNRGSALVQLGRPDQALRDLERVLDADPAQAEAWHRHGRALQELSRLNEALASYQRALALDAARVDAWVQRGMILRELARPREAADAFHCALAHGADPELVRFFLASVQPQSGAAPSAAPAGYVQGLFDDYADSFDTHLVGALHYRAHSALVDALAPLLAARGRPRWRSAIDLGCGTGLCGTQLRPWVERLVGVDLSGRMIDKARALGVYDELRQADIVDALRDDATHHDLVVAADVFIYVGELAPVFAAVARTLADDGVFCFSVESAVDDVPWVLLPSLRYAHGERALRELAAAHGLTWLESRYETIRMEQRQPIDGMCVYLGRSPRRPGQQG